MFSLQNSQGENIDFFTEVTKFSAYMRQSEFARLMALYELYGKTMGLPGSLAEFGIWKGSTFFFLARLIETFHAAQHERLPISQRHLYGFERFGGFAEISEEDLSSTPHDQRRVGGLATNRDVFIHTFEHFKKVSRIAERVHLVEGDVSETFPRFNAEKKGVKFAFVLLDMDVYKPTKAVLDHILDHMVPNGIIVFDEYAQPEWPGETLAADEFIGRWRLELESIPWAFGPTAYCRVTPEVLMRWNREKRERPSTEA